ncbi:MAG: hypothetical protein ACE5MM_04445 [Nitrospiraceae bacterium]
MHFLKRAALVFGLAGSVLFVVTPFGTRAGEKVMKDEFDLLPLAESYRSRATVEIRRKGSEKEEVRINVQNARPNDFYTVWIRLQDFNPLTRRTKSTALAPASRDEIDGLIQDTPDQEDFNACFARGSTDVINGFWTDGDGNGKLRVPLDFRLTDGFYPFDKYNEDYPSVPIKRARFGGATLRIVSHCDERCCDQMGHGLVPGPHQGWFDWSIR